MGQGISEVLTFAVGVAISPVPIIAVILMLFSARARLNGPMFLVGWVVALAVVAGVVYIASDTASVASDATVADAVSWAKIGLGVLMLLLALRSWRSRPAPGRSLEMPRWMAGIDELSPGKAFGLAFLLAGVNPKNLLLTAGAAAGLAQLGLATKDAVVSLAVFVLIGSLTIAGPVIYYLLGGEQAKQQLEVMKVWLAAHNAAVMTVLFLVFGANLISAGLAPLSA